MLGGRRLQMWTAACVGFVVLLSVFAVQNNHHRAAMDYLDQTLRLTVLEILYPEKHFTRDNYTSFHFFDPIVEKPFAKYHEVAEEPEYQRENATFFSLVRNEELYMMLQSIKYVERRFNRRYHYPWIFANDQDFTEDFKAEVQNLVSGEVTFVTIPKEFWSYPDFIDQDRAKETRELMLREGIKYGGSESYRHMCRFNSGFFYKLKELDKYRYYWRVEPDIKFTCDLPFDFFKFMRENGLKYGFSMTVHELHNTVFGLWEATKEYFQDLHPDYIHKNNQVEFVTQDGGETYNMCHYWSNFEIGDLDFYRSKEYEGYFQYLEQKGGFFYERWGDAPIHSFAVSYLLDKSEIYYFDNTGYYHVPHIQCPRSIDVRSELHCSCAMAQDFNWGSSDSCLAYYFETKIGHRPESAPRRKYITQKENKKKREFIDGNEVDDDVESIPEDKALKEAPIREAYRY